MAIESCSPHRDRTVIIERQQDSDDKRQRSAAWQLHTFRYRTNDEPTGSQLLLTGVSVEKVPQVRLVEMQRSGYKQASDAAVRCNIRRPAANDGKPLPLRVAVLLL